MNQCQATTKDGKPCQAQPVRPSGYCPWHDPALAQQRSGWNANAGRHRSNRLRAAKRMQTATNRQEVAADLLDVMAKVKQGRIRPAEATAIATLARAYVAVLGDTDVEDRLDALERLINRRVS